MKSFIKFITSSFFGNVILPILCLFGLVCLFGYLLSLPPSQDYVEKEFKENVRKVEHEGHTYLLYFKDSKCGLCHDENCNCKRLCK